MNSWFSEKKPVIALAPMADMTDSAFCQIARECSGSDFVVFREMVNAQAIVQGNDQTRQMCAFSPTERPIVQQVFGADPATMAEATRIIDAEYGPDGFDINMGCPARKIVSNFNGSALMRDPETAATIVREMKQATDKPVTVKTRLGWSRPDEILDFALRLEEAGAQALTVHGRTKEQGYSGVADWEMIARVNERLTIPLLVNGDITDGPSATRALEITGAAGLMIGRGALGNPWIFAEIRQFFAGEMIQPPTDQEVAAVVLKHARLHAAEHGGDRPLVSLRSHLAHYFKGRPGAKEWRTKAILTSTVEELERITTETLPQIG
jgi:tRNA-dihydrouridine synthase B